MPSEFRRSDIGIEFAVEWVELGEQWQNRGSARDGIDAKAAPHDARQGALYAANRWEQGLDPSHEYVDQPIRRRCRRS